MPNAADFETILIGAGIGFASLVLTAIVAPSAIALGWLWYRPLISVVVLGSGLAIAVGLRMLARRRVAVRTAIGRRNRRVAKPVRAAR